MNEETLESIIAEAETTADLAWLRRTVIELATILRRYMVKSQRQPPN